jgi:hypothetical protein
VVKSELLIFYDKSFLCVCSPKTATPAGKEPGPKKAKEGGRKRTLKKRREEVETVCIRTKLFY